MTDTPTEIFHVVFGIRIDGREMDYCREQLVAETRSDAEAEAEAMLRGAPEPPRGELFIVRVEAYC